MIKPIMFLLLLFSVPASAEQPLMLAKHYQPGLALEDYWVSEKLDGVRARWDGERLISRGGKVFAAPDWFTRDFPAVVLDGELWIARGQYQQTVSIVRKKTPHAGWRKIRLMVFDLPLDQGNFDQRVQAMQRLMRTNQSPYLAMITQFKVPNHEALQNRLNAFVEANGEGLILHKATAGYQPGRSNHLLKFKPYYTAEAVVLGYKPGKGKFAGLTGSLKVNFADKIFYVGSGLKDSERRNPPPIGSTITFRYQGFTQKGLPRFPTFIRLRAESPESK